MHQKIGKVKPDQVNRGFKSNAIQMLLGIAIGDALGAGYEFRYKNLFEYKGIDYQNYRKHPKEDSKHEAGMYTDDTQMSIAITEALLRNCASDPEKLAHWFVRTYKSLPIDGYSQKFQSFLNSINNGQEFIEKVNPKSYKNGAAMRSVPLGILSDLKNVIYHAIINAELTHDTPSGIASSVVIALMSHYKFYYGRYPNLEKEIIPHIKDIDPDTVDYLREVDKISMKDRMCVRMGTLLRKHSNVGVPCNGMFTIGAVWYTLKFNDVPSYIARTALNLGGDTDSVASISLGLHMINDTRGFPFEWANRLYDGFQGKKYLIGLGKKLNDKFPINANCEKFTFNSEEEAKSRAENIEEWEINDFWNLEGEEKKKLKKLSVYQCDKCNKFHLTSMSRGNYDYASSYVPKNKRNEERFIEREGRIWSEYFEEDQ